VVVVVHQNALEEVNKNNIKKNNMKKVTLVFCIVSSIVGCTSSVSSEKEVVSDSTSVVDSVKVDTSKVK
jgi:hypothetical protein